MSGEVVITGIGMVTPLGRSPGKILRRMGEGESVAVAPCFDASPFYCPVSAPVPDFDAEAFFPDNKTLRLMNRDAQMAVVAARLAMQDANVRAGEAYASEDIGLFGATGMTGLPVDEISRLVECSAGQDGSLDLTRLGQVGLKRVRPVLSFKILANIPICFVSIFEGIRGENGVYTPWEGQGARAIEAGIRAIRQDRAACALVGGCDVKTHEFSFISLQQLGVLDSWRDQGRGIVPGEGAAFLVLENETTARNRGARIYARFIACRFATVDIEGPLEGPLSSLLSGMNLADRKVQIVSAADGEPGIAAAEEAALATSRITAVGVTRPKASLGNLFAAAAAVQVGLAAHLAGSVGDRCRVLADCFGFGAEQAVFVLEAP